MIFFKFYNGKKFYYFNGVLKRFRERVDENMTDDELKYILKKINFPILGVTETKNGKRKLVGYYNVNLIEEWINSRKDELEEKLREKRRYDSGALERFFRDSPKKITHDYRSEEEIRRDCDERNKREMEKRRAEILRKLAEIEKKERRIPDEDMENVSDELLRQSDVGYGNE